MQAFAPFLPAEILTPVRKIEADLSWVSRLPPAAWQRPGSPIVDARMALLYAPDETCFFGGDDPFALMRNLPGLLALHMETQRPLPHLDALETYQCYLQFFALSDASQAELEAYCQPIADQISLVSMAPVSEKTLSLPPVFQQIIQAQLHILDLPQTIHAKGRLAGLIQIVKNALTFTQNQVALAQLDAVSIAAQNQADSAPLRNFLQTLLQEAAAVDAPADSLAAIKNTRAMPAGEQALSATPTQSAVKTKWIKVEQTKIDRLLELLGELAVAQNGLLHRLDGHNAAALLAQVHERHDRNNQVF